VTASLEVTGLIAGYGRAEPILRGIDLTVSGGLVTTIIGPNGAGKSTLLKVIAGLVPVREGTLSINERDATRTPAVNRTSLGVSLCGQGRVNFPHLTVEENMKLAGFTLSRAKLRARFHELRQSDTVTDKRWHDRVSNLSGGQQQSVEITMALITEPSVLLLDEPSLGLAPAARVAVFERIRRIADSGVCVLVVEQNVKAASAVSDRLVVLDQGRVVLDGHPSSILDDEALRHVYVGGLGHVTHATPELAKGTK
jgi:branched-chain amino acid transport system ATP-binding protein